MSEQFKELREALQNIERDNQWETSNAELETWCDAIRLSVARQAGFGSLTDDEIELIARGVLEHVPMPSSRLQRLRRNIEQRFADTPKRKLLSHWENPLRAGDMAAAMFRSDAPVDSDEGKTVEETLERIRRRLDQSDHES